MSSPKTTADADASTSTTDCWYLTGPTAAGKTTVGIELAKRLDAEILSLDSMAIYRGMDIGTAKPTAEQRAQVPHHLLDLLEPTEEFSVSGYVEQAKQKIAEIRSRGRQPLFVGGTPLYLKSLLRGIFSGPPADWQFREAIEEEIAEVGIAPLHQRLQQVDPLSAAKLHPHDKRRIIRALEVYKTTGRPISHLQTQFDEGLPAQRCRVFVLQWPRDVLHERIERRVNAMFDAGLIVEVQALLHRYRQLGRTASQAVGYREVIEYLKGGREVADTIEAVKARTRQFARRQETWFRSLSECRFIPLTSDATPATVTNQIIEAVK